MVNHPPHYTAGKYETADVIEDAGFGWHLGNAFKYMHRAKYKGKEEEDIRKCLWFIMRFLEVNYPQPVTDGVFIPYDQGSSTVYWNTSDDDDFLCELCERPTFVVDKYWRCPACHKEEPHGYANIDSKGSVTPPKPLDPPGKVIPHNPPKDGLEARTEPLVEADRIYSENAGKTASEFMEQRMDYSKHAKAQTDEMIRREDYRASYRRSSLPQHTPREHEQLTLEQLVEHD